LIGASNPLIRPFLPAQLSETVPGVFRSLNTETRSFDSVQGAKDIAQIKPTITNTLEGGYKGLIGEKLVLSVDVYYSKIKDFVGPLITETPHVFMNADEFVRVLAKDLRANGFPEVLNPEAVARQIANAFSALPLGLASPVEDQSPTTVILTYRNFGDVDLWGSDVSFSFYATPQWIINGTYSYVNKDFFPPAPDQPHPIALNAPQTRAA
jgi:iron complex outermembrane receptor protein